MLYDGLSSLVESFLLLYVLTVLFDIGCIFASFDDPASASGVPATQLQHGTGFAVRGFVVHDTVYTFRSVISKKSRSRKAQELNQRDIHRWVHFPISIIAYLLKLKVKGWINYNGKFWMSQMPKVFQLINVHLVMWICNKYRRFRK